MSTHSGSAHSSPVSLSSLASSSVETSDRLLRSECHRQGGKHCGHVECQVRSRRAHAAAAAGSAATPFSMSAASATPSLLSPSPMTFLRRSAGGSSHQQATASRRTTTTTTTRTTLISSRVLTNVGRLEDFNSTASSRSVATRLSYQAALATAGNIGGWNSSNAHLAGSSKAAAADYDESTEEEEVEKGQHETRFGSKEVSAVFDDFAAGSDAEDDFVMPQGAATARAAAGVGRIRRVAMTTRTTLRRVFYDAPRLALLWLVGLVAMTTGGLRCCVVRTFVVIVGFVSMSTSGLTCAAGGLRRGVVRTFVVIAMATVGFVSTSTSGLTRAAGGTTSSVKSLFAGAVTASASAISHCLWAVSAGVAMLGNCIAYCLVSLARGIASATAGGAYGAKSSLAGFASALVLLVSGAQARLVQVARVSVARLRTATRRAGRRQTAGAGSAAVARRRRRCWQLVLLLLLLLLILLPLLLYYYGLLVLPSSCNTVVTHAQESLRSASESAGKAAAFAWTTAGQAAYSARLWIGGTLSEAAAATFKSRSAGNSADPLTSSVSLPASPASLADAGAAHATRCCDSDLQALEAEVAAMRLAIADLRKQRSPSPVSPVSHPAVDQDAAAALRAASELDKLKVRLTAVESVASAASESARAAAASVEAAAIEAEQRRQAGMAAATEDLRFTSGRLAASFTELVARLRRRTRADAAAVVTAAVSQAAASNGDAAEAAAAAAAIISAVQADMADLKRRIEQLESAAAAAALFKVTQAAPSTTHSQSASLHQVLFAAVAPVPADELPDFALHSAGAHAVNTRCTRPYHLRHSYLQLLGIPVLGFSNGPNTALQPGTQLGECWPFEGFPGHLVIRLAMPARLTGVTIDHVPRRLTFNDSAASAPRNFSVYGLHSEAAAFAEAHHLGSFAYNAESGPASQTFAVAASDVSAEVYPLVELVIHSNHGEAYTCLYRFRVHGSLV